MLEITVGGLTKDFGSIRAVDVGEVNGRIFVNNSGLGLYPLAVIQREKHRRLGWPKWLAFFRAAMATLRRFPFANVRLTIDARRRLTAPAPPSDLEPANKDYRD